MAEINIQADLEELDLNDRELTSLPKLPENLKELYCNNNILTSMPKLPDTLKVLMCANNLLISLPKLPKKLTSLDCENNQLTSLPKLPENLVELDCMNNQLTSIPKLPENLTSFYCDNNEVSFIPKLPKTLQYLECANNPLEKLPKLPENIIYIKVSFDQPHLFEPILDNNSLNNSFIIRVVDSKKNIDIIKYNKKWIPIIKHFGNRIEFYVRNAKIQLEENINALLTITPQMPREVTTVNQLDDELPKDSVDLVNARNKVFRNLGEEIRKYLGGNRHKTISRRTRKSRYSKKRENKNKSYKRKQL